MCCYFLWVIFFCLVCFFGFLEVVWMCVFFSSSFLLCSSQAFSRRHHGSPLSRETTTVTAG